MTQSLRQALDHALLLGMILALLVGPVLGHWTAALGIMLIDLGLAILLYLCYGGPTDNDKE